MKFTQIGCVLVLFFLFCFVYPFVLVSKWPRQHVKEAEFRIKSFWFSRSDRKLSNFERERLVRHRVSKQKQCFRPQTKQIIFVSFQFFSDENSGIWINLLLNTIQWIDDQFLVEWKKRPFFSWWWWWRNRARYLIENKIRKTTTVTSSFRIRYAVWGIRIERKKTLKEVVGHLWKTRWKKKINAQRLGSVILMLIACLLLTIIFFSVLLFRSPIV